MIATLSTTINDSMSKSGRHHHAHPRPHLTSTHPENNNSNGEWKSAIHPTSAADQTKNANHADHANTVPATGTTITPTTSHKSNDANSCRMPRMPQRNLRDSFLDVADDDDDDDLSEDSTIQGTVVSSHTEIVPAKQEKRKRNKQRTSNNEQAAGTNTEARKKRWGSLKSQLNHQQQDHDENSSSQPPVSSKKKTQSSGTSSSEQRRSRSKERRSTTAKIRSSSNDGRSDTAAVPCRSSSQEGGRRTRASSREGRRRPSSSDSRPNRSSSQECKPASSSKITASNSKEGRPSERSSSQEGRRRRSSSQDRQSNSSSGVPPASADLLFTNTSTDPGQSSSSAQISSRRSTSQERHGRRPENIVSTITPTKAVGRSPSTDAAKRRARSRSTSRERLICRMSGDIAGQAQIDHDTEASPKYRRQHKNQPAPRNPSSPIDRSPKRTLSLPEKTTTPSAASKVALMYGLSSQPVSSEAAKSPRRMPKGTSQSPRTGRRKGMAQPASLPSVMTDATTKASPRGGKKESTRPVSMRKIATSQNIALQKPIGSTIITQTTQATGQSSSASSSSQSLTDEKSPSQRDAPSHPLSTSRSTDSSDTYGSMSLKAPSWGGHVQPKRCGMQSSSHARGSVSSSSKAATPIPKLIKTLSDRFIQVASDSPIMRLSAPRRSASPVTNRKQNKAALAAGADPRFSSQRPPRAHTIGTIKNSKSSTSTSDQHHTSKYKALSVRDLQKPVLKCPSAGSTVSKTSNKYGDSFLNFSQTDRDLANLAPSLRGVPNAIIPTSSDRTKNSEVTTPVSNIKPSKHLSLPAMTIKKPMSIMNFDAGEWMSDSEDESDDNDGIAETVEKLTLNQESALSKLKRRQSEKDASKTSFLEGNKKTKKKTRKKTKLKKGSSKKSEGQTNSDLSNSSATKEASVGKPKKKLSKKKSKKEVAATSAIDT